GFALLTDAAMLTLGGTLKRKEKISGRFADILSLLYLASASLKRFEDQGRPDADLPLVKWVCDECLYEIQQAMLGILQNFPNAVIGKILQWTIFPYGKRFSPPSDEAGHQIASLLIKPSEARDRLTRGIYLPESDSQQVARLEEAFKLADEADLIEKRLYGLKRQGQINGRNIEDLLNQADQKVLITDKEAKLLARFLELKNAIIKVDDFSANEFKKR
ncbi:MAG TPA: DUF1974 domain-containing protein, partial [Gammaproteobacteria bacterium]|nr:DUF1974 domain-containing protein [Gammaproteobacteria bacterium]